MPNETSEFEINFGFTEINNNFVFYFSGLFLQAYILALFVSYLHTRVNAVVFPLTAPEDGTKFTEYIILIKTSLKLGSSMDPRARVNLQLKGNFDDSPRLLLQRGKNIDFFLCRGGVNIFVYHSPNDLGDIVELEIELYNDTPYEIPSVQWRPTYICVHQPVSKMFWGCPINILLQTEDKLTQSFECLEKKRDEYSLSKCLCLFHVWLSIFNSPVRLGMYNTVVNVIIVFFCKALLILSLLFVYKLSSTDGKYLAAGVVVVVIWQMEIALEAFIRNTISSFRAAKHSLFSGLVEPSESLYDFDNFALAYNWDNVRPLVVRNTAVLVTGSKHPSVYCMFPVARPNSVYNMWGLLSQEKEKETRQINRILNECALPLPATMNWLAIEASGRKEEVLIQHATSKFTASYCLFETWLLDWPLVYADEPHVAGLIISHIMMSDLLMLMKVKHTRKRSHLAQLCVHQWHGMLCCLFLFIIDYHLEGSKSSSLQIKHFISKTLTQFGKRSPREIKASWIKRKTGKLNYSQRPSVMRLLEDSQNRDLYVADINTSSRTDRDRGSYGPRGNTDDVVVDTLIIENEDTITTVNSQAKKNKETAGVLNRRGKGGDWNQNAINTNEDDDDAPEDGSDEGEKKSDEEEEDDDVEEGTLENMKTALMPLAEYETEFIGPPHLVMFTPILEKDNLYRRYNNELLAYCCKKKRCVLFRQIHRKVGGRVLEVLNSAMQDLLDFVRSDPIKKDSSKKSAEKKKETSITIVKIWKRKRMVSKMINDLKKKARLYDDMDFGVGAQPMHQGFNCNRLLTSIHTNLKFFVDEVSQNQAPIEVPTPVTSTKRCVYCAKPLQRRDENNNIGCYNVNRLARFLSQGTVYVSEKELNSQLVSRYTVQNFCAMMMSQARSEAHIELEDPPIVMSAHVLQAMIHYMLNNMLPKQTEFHDLSADELRKLGTRLQRIRARYMTSFEEENRSKEEKSKLEKIKHLLKELGARWQMSSHSKALMVTAQLLAECLVQERIMGLSVYSGFITQDHVMLLNGDKERLMEVESKATAAVLKIARTLCEPIVKKTLDNHDEIDVIFTDKARELNFMVESLAIAEYRNEPVFLATCTYYIADVVTLKIKEFKMLSKYMNELSTAKGMESSPIPKSDLPFKFNDPIKSVDGYVHADVCSPMLRWGDVVIKGEPPLSKEYIPARFLRNPAGEHVSDLFANKKPTTQEDKVMAALIGAKRGVDNYTKTEEYDKEKQLQHHLARVQAHLMDQQADATQAISQTTALDSDYVNEFHQDQLYNVELYASHKLNLPIATFFGVCLLVVMVVLTLFAMFVTCIKGTAMNITQVKECSMLCFLGVAVYVLFFQPLKCVFYWLARIYVD